MTMVYVIVGYAIGFLVFPFVWSVSAGWPLAKARPDCDDVLFSLLMCALWPAIIFFGLVYVWWCVISALGARARSLCDRAWKDFARWARES